MNFFERMEYEIDFQMEYNKLENLLIASEGHTVSSSLFAYIWHNFLDWSDRGSYTSFGELRDHVGFPVDTTMGVKFLATNVTMEDYFVYCEMILNICKDSEINSGFSFFHQKIFGAILDTMEAVISKTGHKIQEVEIGLIIVKDDAAAISVADVVDAPVGDAIIEYNHYLLRGNNDRKRALLLIIANDLEPKEAKLKQLGFKDLFLLYNEMNIRHNNISPEHAKFHEEVARMSPNELERWYDDIYQMSLLAYLTLEHQKRKTRIDEYKRERGLA